MGKGFIKTGNETNWGILGIGGKIGSVGEVKRTEMGLCGRAGMK